MWRRARTARVRGLVRGQGKAAGPGGAGGCERGSFARPLDGLADRIDDGADLGAQEDESDDRDDRDEREDQSVLSEALAFVVVADGRNQCKKLRHGIRYLLPSRIPRRSRGVRKVGGPPA